MVPALTDIAQLPHTPHFLPLAIALNFRRRHPVITISTFLRGCIYSVLMNGSILFRNGDSFSSIIELYEKSKV